MPKIILHIGTYKTGSTAIQAFMRRNESTFEAQGVIYPTFRGDSQSHTFLCQAIRTNNKEGLEECTRTLRRAFHERPEATVVLSSEHFWPMNGPHLHTMLDILETISADIRVLMYVRSQGRLWASLYAQQSKSMSVRPEHKLWGRNSFIGARIANHGMYYFECLEEYAKRFGRDHVTAKIYDRKLFNGGDVITDFLAFLGSPIPVSGNSHLPDTNLSYGWKAVELSKYFAINFGEMRYKGHPAPGALRRTVTRLAKNDNLEGWLGGYACFLSANEQMRIREYYAASNRKLAEAYFGGLDPFSGEELMPTCPHFLDIPEPEIKKANRYMAEFLQQSDADLPVFLQDNSLSSTLANLDG